MLRVNLKYLREKYDFTYTQAERMFGLGRGTYASHEKNEDYKITPSVLLKILGVYNALEGGLTLEKLLTVDLENTLEEMTDDENKTEENTVKDSASKDDSNLDVMSGNQDTWINEPKNHSMNKNSGTGSNAVEKELNVKNIEILTKSKVDDKFLRMLIEMVVYKNKVK